MGALIKWGGLIAIGALGARSVTDGVGDNVQKITPILVVGIGAAAMAGAVYIATKNA